MKLKTLVCISLFFLLTLATVKAQEVAVIDQGRNTTLTNRGSFFSPWCYFAIGELWQPYRLNFTSPTQDLNAMSTLDNKGTMSLCYNGFSYKDHLNNTPLSSVSGTTPLAAFADVPKTKRLPSLAPQSIAMVTRYNNRHFLNQPYASQKFGANLEHGTHVANAVNDFDPSIRKRMMQVWYMSEVRTNPNDCASAGNYSFNQSTARTSLNSVIAALREIVNNPQGVDAVNISLAFRSSYCQRQQNVFVSPSCNSVEAKDVISDLYNLGIPVVTGMYNYDIGSSEKTFPACMEHVIKVGADNDNFNYPIGNGGIGIGANGIDFYAKNSISVTGNGTAIGNSMAAPRVAAAYAMLKHAVPISTIELRTTALRETATRTNTDQGYTKEIIKKANIQAAISLLEILSTGTLEVLAFSDDNSYGSIYGDASSNYSFQIDFNNLIGSSAINTSNTTTGDETSISSNSLTVSSVRDVVLSFDGKMSSNLSNGFRVYVNNTQRVYVSPFLNEQSFELTLPRNVFSSGANTIRIQPIHSTRLWGISNIKAEFTPVVELTLNQLDTTKYGSEEDPPRPTGMRATFELDNVDNDVMFAITGWDMDFPEEVAIYLNGIAYGHLKQGSSNQNNAGDLFVFTKADLNIGGNVIELVQKDGVDAWGVSNLLITQDAPGTSTLLLGTKDTTMYGRNYGTNENFFQLDAQFTPRNDHDHKISWRAFDVEQSGDVSVYLNNIFIKNVSPTANASLGSTETITIAWRLFLSGVNTLSFRVSANPFDDTWGVTDLLVNNSSVINLDDEDNLNKDFGYFERYSGGTPAGWTRNYSAEDYQTRLHATFSSNATEDKEINVTGWDIDSPTEMAMYLNGSFLQYVTSALSSSIYSETDRTTIPKTSLINGTNTLTFKTQGSLSNFQNEKWGLKFGEIGSGAFMPPIIMLLMSD